MGARLTGFNRIFKQYSNHIYRFGFRLVGNQEEAEDITQETFLKLYRFLESKPKIVNPKAWIYRVAANICYNHLKRKKRFRKILENNPSEAGLNLIGCSQKDVESDLIKQEEIAMIRNALSQLPVRDRIVLGLYKQGLAYKDIARIIKVRESSTRTILYRAIDKLERNIKGGKK